MFLAREMGASHSEKVSKWLRDPGVEIGAFKYPVPGIKPYYVDLFEFYAYERCLADYWGDATQLPFHDNSLNYVVTSHVLEHVANPVAALVEWYRVLKPGGIIYLLVPDRRFTWDRERPLTTVDHMMEDFAKETTQSDGTHIDDFVDNVIWSEYNPAVAPSEVAADKARQKGVYHHAVSHKAEINIHFHTFEPSNVLGLLERVRTDPSTKLALEVVDQAERFPQENPIGFLVVARVNKSSGERLSAAAQRLSRRLRGISPVLPTAKKFDSPSPQLKP